MSHIHAWLETGRGAEKVVGALLVDDAAAVYAVSAQPPRLVI